jgi:outer membrane lipoprotein
MLAVATLAACMRPPRPLEGEFPPLTVADAQQGEHAGERVRWGGTIVATRPERDRTCIEVVSKPLDRRARSILTDQTYGRFEACARGFYDPEIYAEGREVTVVGTIEGTRAGKVGDYDYPFPRVDAEWVYLWPERRPERAYYYDPYPWYPWWGWYGGGAVVVVPRGPMIHHGR